jgi:hypothetical protein
VYLEVAITTLPGDEDIMKTQLIPKTTTRVEEATASHVNERIRREMSLRIARYRDADEDSLGRRLEELEREWDMERTLEANAATITLATLALGKTMDKKWYVFPAVVAAFLLQHAIQGWCPPVPVFRRLGVRTAREIEEEKRALLAVLERRQGGSRAAPGQDAL